MGKQWKQCQTLFFFHRKVKGQKVCALFIHVEGVRKPLAHSLVIWAPVEVPSIQAWETYIPGVKCGDFVEMIFVCLRSLFEVFLSLLVLNKTKKSGKMEVLGFGNRRSSSKKEFCSKNILLF